MNHIVIPIRYPAQMVVPVGGVFAHEFGDHREDGKSIQRKILSAQRLRGRHINIVNLTLFLVLRGKRRRRELGQGRVCGIERKRAGLGDGYIDMNIFVKIWLQTISFWGVRRFRSSASILSIDSAPHIFVLPMLLNFSSSPI